MRIDEVIAAYNEAVFDTDRQRALRVVREAVSKGLSPEEIVFDVVLPAMDRMTKAISEDFDANLAQHFMAAQIGSEVTEEMLAGFQKTPEVCGHVIIGTAQGDLHTLGKRIVIGCLKARIVDVTDVGVNVPPERFVDEAVAHDAAVIGISAMMVHTARGENGCLAVRRILKERGLEGRIKLVVGGAAFRFDHELYKTVQADAWAEDGVTAGKVITDLMSEARP